MTDNNSAPERIWANGLGVYGEYAGFGGTEYIRADIRAALQPTEAVAKPFKMAISNDTLKQMIESDPDNVECEAGYLATPPTDNTALVTAVQALGAMPEGYCFCHRDRIGDDSKVHDPECRDIRAALASIKDRKQCHSASIEPATGALTNGPHGSGANAHGAVASAALARREAPPAVTVPFQPTHQHVKRGAEYQEMARGKLQTDVPLSDYAALVAYRAADGSWWFRSPTEFDDGRFRALGGSN